MISISVDDWQHVSFLRDVIDSINRSQSDITITSLSDHFQLYEIKKSVPNLNSSLVFYVHPSTIGLWRACDNLSGEELNIDLSIAIFFLSLKATF